LFTIKPENLEDFKEAFTKRKEELTNKLNEDPLKLVEVLLE
jgi:hypothetical protein